MGCMSAADKGRADAAMVRYCTKQLKRVPRVYRSALRLARRCFRSGFSGYGRLIVNSVPAL